jgi:hypothetical protein
MLRGPRVAGWRSGRYPGTVARGHRPRPRRRHARSIRPGAAGRHGQGHDRPSGCARSTSSPLLGQALTAAIARRRHAPAARRHHPLGGQDTRRQRAHDPGDGARTRRIGDALDRAGRDACQQDHRRSRQPDRRHGRGSGRTRCAPRPRRACRSSRTICSMMRQSALQVEAFKAEISKTRRCSAG